MFQDTALTGLFKNHEAALLAGERLREVVGPRGFVRVLFPGSASSLVEVSVLPSKGGTVGVAVGGALLGIAGFVALLAFGLGWAMASLALAWGVASGAMLAWWLTGAIHPLQTLRGADAKRCYELLKATPRAVVVVMGDASREATVRATIESARGEVFCGLNPWVAAATHAPAPPLPLPR